MPEASRNFHYQQPAPRWRLLPWLANPGNPAISPHTGKGKRHPSFHSGKREEEIGKTAYPDDELPLQTMLQVHTQSTHKKASNKVHMEFQ